MLDKSSEIAKSKSSYVAIIVLEKRNGTCVCDLDSIRFGFMTCYDVYFNEQIEYLARHKPDIIVVPGYQRGERVDIIEAQEKLTALIF
ncbi:MAG: hypothetical protein U0M42_08290 [Acutalibacteraceae bacterium]|nr:hypothetical protein [Acutalibacteraceae bacterium]